MGVRILQDCCSCGAALPQRWQVPRVPKERPGEAAGRTLQVGKQMLLFAWKFNNAIYSFIGRHSGVMSRGCKPSWPVCAGLSYQTSNTSARLVVLKGDINAAALLIHCVAGPALG